MKSVAVVGAVMALLYGIVRHIQRKRDAAIMEMCLRDTKPGDPARIEILDVLSEGKLVSRRAVKRQRQLDEGTRGRCYA